MSFRIGALRTTRVSVLIYLPRSAWPLAFVVTLTQLVLATAPALICSALPLLAPLHLLISDLFLPHFFLAPVLFLAALLLALVLPRLCPLLGVSFFRASLLALVIWLKPCTCSTPLFHLLCPSFNSFRLSLLCPGSSPWLSASPSRRSSLSVHRWHCFIPPPRVLSRFCCRFSSTLWCNDLP